MEENSILSAANTDRPAKLSDRPSRGPEELADLVSGLSNQQKAEITYELVVFAAIAAEETGHQVLNEFLAELEDLAAVYTSPERRRDLRKNIREALKETSPADSTAAA